MRIRAYITSILFIMNSVTMMKQWFGCYDHIVMYNITYF